MSIRYGVTVSVVFMTPCCHQLRKNSFRDPMYDLSVSSTSERTLRLLTLLQARPVWSGRELARRLETTTRTVRTDITRLRELGYQVEGVSGVAGGYRLRSGESVPPLLFDEDEAVAVLVGLRQMINTSMAGMDEAAESAIGKILQLLPARLRDQARAVADFTDTEDVGHGVEPELIRTLAAACQQCTALERCRQL
jgi:predicted DNA-binding transcriptional regulator YafY